MTRNIAHPTHTMRNVACLLIAAVAFIPGATAALGYLETFSNGQPPTSSWYVASGTGGASDWRVVNPGLFQSCQCVSPTSFNNFNINAGVRPAAGSDWSLNFTYNIHRGTTSEGSGIGLQITTSGLTNIGAGSVSWQSSATLLTYLTPCGSTTVANTATDHTGTIRVSFVKATNTLNVDLDNGAATCAHVNAGWSVISDFHFALAGSPIVASDYANADNVVYNPNNGATFTFPITPRAVPGLIAQVTQNWTGSQSTVVLKWVLSPDDPNQDTGNLTYKIFVNGVSVGNDGVTPLDGDGGRTHTLIFTGTTPTGTASYWIVASDNGNDAPPSCIVTVTDTIQDDTDACGDINPGNPTGNVTTSAGGGLLSFAMSIGFSTKADLFLFGLILLVIVMALVFGITMALSKNKQGNPARGAALGGGLLAGIVAIPFMLFLTVVGFWDIIAFILIGLAAAAIVSFAARKWMGAS